MNRTYNKNGGKSFEGNVTDKGDRGIHSPMEVKEVQMCNQHFIQNHDGVGLSVSNMYS
jgi:hypothetical protein